MAIVCHFITSSNDPSHGGMEETLDRLATRLAGNDDLTVIVYTMDLAAHVRSGMPYQVEDLSGERAHFVAPFVEGDRLNGDVPKCPSAESFQINRLLLRAHIEAALASRPSDRHILVSFFFTKFGFTAQLVAQELNLPHVACVAGSDLNRDVASPAGMAAATFVVEHADWIVVRTREQATRLERLFKRAHGISVYNGGLPDGSPRGYWKRNANACVSLVSDCGYSFKKSTQSLVDAFGRLLREGHPVTLTIVGKTAEGQREYWETARKDWNDRFGSSASFHGQVVKEDVECMLLHGDIYCSASLGEGSPNGALFALALGMPVVAPQLSSLADVSDPGIDPVSLFRAGDREDFYSCLTAMISRVRNDPPRTDHQRVESIKRRLSEEESRNWLNVIRTVAKA
jgi:glycosyltransferase involved in cell wall biosynthesis